MISPKLKRKPTDLEDLMLDELKHILLILRERMIKKNQYVELMGRLLETIRQVEKKLETEF